MIDENMDDLQKGHWLTAEKLNYLGDSVTVLWRNWK